MFDFLKKKLGDALNALTGKKKETDQPPAPKAEETREPLKPAAPVTPVKAEEKPIKPEKKQKPSKEKSKPKEPVSEKPSLEELIPEHTPTVEELESLEPVSPIKEPAKPPVKEEKRVKFIETEKEEEAKTQPKVGLLGKLKQAVMGKSKFSEKEARDFAETIEVLLWESDVDPEAATLITSKLKQKMSNLEYARNEDPANVARRAIREVLEETMHYNPIDLDASIESKKPYVILFLGPNGAGKTTTIARMAHYLKKRGKKVILSASDTFRAASIEQLEVHAKNLDLRIVKHKYGADPAAVAFDAIQAAKANGLDVVLIDSAGRQETNQNLMGEMKKIVKVANPDLKVFVGEALAGHALLNQIEAFQKDVGVDGVILTKIDADAKGGGAISILSRLKLPIMFVGVGQNYDDLEEFTPKMIIDRIL